MTYVVPWSTVSENASTMLLRQYQRGYYFRSYYKRFSGFEPMYEVVHCINNDLNAVKWKKLGGNRNARASVVDSNAYYWK